MLGSPALAVAQVLDAEVRFFKRGVREVNPHDAQTVLDQRLQHLCVFMWYDGAFSFRMLSDCNVQIGEYGDLHLFTGGANRRDDLGELRTPLTFFILHHTSG